MGRKRLQHNRKSEISLLK